VIKLLIYDSNFEFNPKCILLGLLYQYTHKYNYLHQTLIDVYTQDISYQIEMSNSPNGSTSQNSFLIYQLHWESQ